MGRGVGFGGRIANFRFGVSAHESLVLALRANCPTRWRRGGYDRRMPQTITDHLVWDNYLFKIVQIQCSKMVLTGMTSIP